MKQYQILIFDLDDTLTDDYASCQYAYQKLLEKASLQEEKYPFEKWKNFDTIWWDRWEQGEIIIPDNIQTLEDKITFLRAGRFQEFFHQEKFSYQNYIDFNLFYLSQLGENIIRTPGSLEFFKKNQDKMNIIMTNGPKDAAYQKLQKAGLLPYIMAIFSAEDCGYSKPMPEFYDYLKKELNINFKNALMIGDGLTTDIQGGNLAEIDTAWYNPNNRINNSENIPTYEFQTFEQLNQILEGKEQEKEKINFYQLMN